jgi:large subunit ribosomal protein L24
MACHIRQDDQVVVIAGENKGTRGKVLKVHPKRGLVWIQGVNMVYRHVRPSRRNPQGGRIQKEAPIHISNVARYDEKTSKGSRIRFVVERDGQGKVISKQKVSTAGTSLGEVTRKKAGE